MKPSHQNIPYRYDNVQPRRLDETLPNHWENNVKLGYFFIVKKGSRYCKIPSWSCTNSSWLIWPDVKSCTEMYEYNCFCNITRRLIILTCIPRWTASACESPEDAWGGLRHFHSKTRRKATPWGWFSVLVINRFPFSASVFLKSILITHTRLVITHTWDHGLFSWLVSKFSKEFKPLSPHAHSWTLRPFRTNTLSP